MIFKVILVYLIGLVVTLLIRTVDAKIAQRDIEEIRKDVLKFSLFWFVIWPLFFLFLAIDKLGEKKAGKAIKVLEISK